MIETWELPQGVLEFEDESHTYIFEGVVLPSITQILRTKFKNKYCNVSQAVLNRAAEKGTAMHEAIEEYETKGVEADLLELRNYKFLKKHYGWEFVKAEQPIVLFKDNEPIAAGRFDQLIKIDNQLGINDFKRTSVFDKNYVAIQTTLYAIAYEQTYGDKIDFVCGTHLREDVRKFYKWDKCEELAWDIVNEFMEKEQ